MAAPATVDASIAAKVAEIKAQPYAKFVNNEDMIQRHFGYRIVRQQVAIGKNSMIYKAEAPKFNDLYCLVKSYKLGKEKVKSTFREETVEIMRFLGTRCPQLVGTYDIFYSNDKFYIISDWSSRGDVLNAIKTRSVKVNESLLRQWTLDMLSAVQFLHQNAICHRNIAPSCLLLTPDNHVKLTCLSDAAIYCKPDGTLIKHKWSRFSRTLNWNQPPEVAKGKQYDSRRADIWSVGATVYWFVTRSYPIDYRLTSRLTRQLDNRMHYMRKVTSKCQSFVKKLLSFQPSERPTVGEALQLSWVSGTSSAAAAEITSPSPAAQQMQVAESAPLPDGQGEAPGEAAGADEGSPGPDEASASASTSQRQPPGAAAGTTPEAADDQSPAA